MTILKWILLGVLAILAGVGIWAIYVMWPVFEVLLHGIH
jgi:hypothetical protein